MSSVKVYSETYRRAYPLDWADNEVNQPLSSFQATSLFRQEGTVDSLLLKPPGSLSVSGVLYFMLPKSTNLPKLSRFLQFWRLASHKRYYVNQNKTGEKIRYFRVPLLSGKEKPM